jgi:hypothetical protein
MPGNGNVRGTAVSRLPLGLLSMFGIKTQGAYPLYLRDDYTPSIEMLDQLTTIHGENLSDVENNLSAVGFAENLTVPQDQIWYVPYATLHVVTGAAATATIQMAINPASLSPFIFALTGVSSIGASGRNSIANGRPFWLAQGDRIGSNVTAITGADTDTTLDIRILRLSV